MTIPALETAREEDAIANEGRPGWTRSASFSALLGGSLGLMLFSLVALPVLNPTYIGWAMADSDSAVYYLGWQFFRREPWNWPPGAIRNYVAPEGTSIGYTDSIPLLALPLKLIQRVLPAHFQYLGVWIALCCVLQGAFGALLVRLFTPNLLLQALGALLFLLYAPFWWRLQRHLTLASHWTLLAALLLLLRQRRPRRVSLWLALIAVVSLVHPYLLAMVMTLWAAELAGAAFVAGRSAWGRILLAGALSGLIALSGFWVSGLLIFRPPPASGYDSLTLNLTAPINPWDSRGIGSAFLKPRPFAMAGQKIEARSNYQGAGVLLLFFAGFCLALSRPVSKKAIVRCLPILAACAACTAYAITNKITLDDRSLVLMNLPGALARFTAVFRVPDRFFIVASYSALALSIALVVTRCKPVYAAVLLSFLVRVQAIDMTEELSYEKQHRYRAGIAWNSPLQSDFWRSLGARYKGIMHIPAKLTAPDWCNLAFLAAEQGMSVNIGYTARPAPNRFNAYERWSEERVREGDLERDKVYVFAEREMWEAAGRWRQEGDQMLEVDGRWVFAPNPQKP
ncbi:MAG: DUF6311 domain-containing protein [Candidatus Sumerlaeota bacterium]|nr:DUF6311 domain-containing protein [Candidatus Sumerlaeota bacterium]